jgi:hypothetical protein
MICGAQISLFKGEISEVDIRALERAAKGLALLAEGASGSLDVTVHPQQLMTHS